MAKVNGYEWIFRRLLGDPPGLAAVALAKAARQRPYCAMAGERGIGRHAVLIVIMLFAGLFSHAQYALKYESVDRSAAFVADTLKVAEELREPAALH